MIYALIALGYTLVYGIIELINFAHGDNFMLGGFQTNSMVNDGSFQIPLFPTATSRSRSVSRRRPTPRAARSLHDLDVPLLSRCSSAW